MTSGSNGSNGSGREPKLLPAVPSAKAAELDRYAREELKLSIMQIRFATYLVTEPSLGYAGAAARAGSRNPKRIGWRMSKMPAVELYMKALRAAAAGGEIIHVPESLTPEVVTATPRTPSPVAFEIDDAIATVTEVLRGATALRRARMGHFMNKNGDHIVSRIRSAPPGVVKRWRKKTRIIPVKDGEPITEIETDLELVDGLGSHALLGRFNGMDKTKGPRKVVFNVKAMLQNLSDDGLDKLQAAIRAARAAAAEARKGEGA